MNIIFVHLLSALGYIILSLIACLVVSYIKRKQPKNPWEMGLKENLLVGFLLGMLLPLSGVTDPLPYVLGFAFLFLCFVAIGLFEEFSQPKSPDVD